MSETKTKRIGEIWTVEELREISKRFPFKILGIDSNNENEYINAYILNYCEEEYITLQDTNFFQSSMKHLEKIRIGSKVTKKYDKPKTHYKRIIESNVVSESKGEKIEKYTKR